MSPVRPQSPFGVELRHWRERRGVSQLRLASSAAMSPRYVSFVETGRARPSRAVVERLADALDVPLRERNRLLVAAGFAPAYPEVALDADALATFRHVVESLLEKQEPYPALVLDGAYRLVLANGAARRLLPELDTMDWIDAAFAPTSPLRAAVENFAEVAWHAADTLRRESNPPQDCLLRLERHLEGIARPAAADLTTEHVLCPRFRFGDRVVRTFTAIARFGTARNVTLDELRVELFFPADEDSARFFRDLAGAEK